MERKGIHMVLARLHRSALRLILPGLAVLLCTLAGCGFSNASASTGCKQIGVFMPDKTTSRWENKDHPLLVQAIQKDLPGASIDYYNADNNAFTQRKQAIEALNKGACILVVAAVNSDTASSIVQQAREKNVPVIAYDRLIEDNSLTFYVSFDGVKVGALQGQYIVDHHHAGDNVMMINGSPSDNNAVLFNQGALNVLQPLFSSGALHLVYSVFTLDWNSTFAQNEAQDALAQTHNTIQIAYVANDGMAGGVIAALQAAHLNRQVLVTGQDASVAGIQQILIGNQSMTVYKAISKEAEATAELIAALSNGTDTSTLVNGKTPTKFGSQIPSILEQPVVVTKSNIQQTVLADGFVTKAEICSGLPPGTDTGGICP